MILKYELDKFSGELFQRMLSNTPEGNYYLPDDGLFIPYTANPVKFKLKTDVDKVGLVHKIYSSIDSSYSNSIVVGELESEISVELPAGEQFIVVEAFNANGDSVGYLTVRALHSNYGTLLYGLSNTFIKEWAELLDIFGKIYSGYKLVTFESSIEDFNRKFFPKSDNLRLLALRYMLRARSFGSTNESIAGFISVFTDLNPVRVSKHTNSETIGCNDRADDGILEDTSVDVKVWYSTPNIVRGAILAKLARNFPERYGGITVGDTSIILDNLDE